jgi:hypothetical protein
VIFNKKSSFEVQENQDLLYGINSIQTQAQALSYAGDGKLITKEVKLKLIPYYAWAHRGSGDMAVWLSTDLGVVRPAMLRRLHLKVERLTMPKISRLSAMVCYPKMPTTVPFLIIIGGQRRFKGMAYV